jgi:hypothetical protein
MSIKKLGGILNDFDNLKGITKLGQATSQGVQRAGSKIKWNIGEGLSNFSPLEVTAMKLASQAYRKHGERAEEVDGFRYLPVLSTDEQAVYIDPDSKHMFLAIRGTANLSDAVTDLRLIARNAQDTPRFTRNREEFVKIANEVQPQSISLVGHSLGGALAIDIFKTFQGQAPFDHIYLFNPAIIIDEMIASGFTPQLVEKSTVYRTQQDIVSVGSAFSNFKVKTMPLNKKDFISGHKIEIFNRILDENEVEIDSEGNFEF